MTSTAQASAPPWRALPVVLVGTFMALLDVFIVNVAAPAIRSDLHLSEDAVQWVVAGYVLPYAVTLIAGGRIGDALGRRRTFRLGMGLFAAASALCGLAPSAGTLIAARALQGLGAALMTPQVLAIIQVEFAPVDRARCMAWFGGVVGVASVAGQLVGGALIALDVLGLGWRAVFLINVPVALAAVAAAGRLVPESRVEGARRLDVGGVILSTLTLVLVVFPIVEGREAGWPLWVPVCLGAAVVTGAMWLAEEERVTKAGGAPLVDLGLFRFAGFRAGLGVVLAIYCAAPCLFLVLAFFLQSGHGLTALESAGVFTPLAVSFVAASFAAPRLVDRYGQRVLGLAASVTATTSLMIAALVLATPGELPLVPLCLLLLLMGCGQGVIMPSIIGTTLATIPPALAGPAAGVLTTTQQVGNVLGVAIAGVIYFGVLGGGGDVAEAFAASTLWTAAGAAIAATLAFRLAAADRRAPDALHGAVPNRT